MLVECNGPLKDNREIVALNRVIGSCGGRGANEETTLICDSTLVPGGPLFCVSHNSPQPSANTGQVTYPS